MLIEIKAKKAGYESYSSLCYQEEKLIGDCSTYTVGLADGNEFLKLFSRDEILEMLTYHYTNNDERWVKLVFTYNTDGGGFTRRFAEKICFDEINVLNWVGEEEFKISVAELYPPEDNEDTLSFLSSFKSTINGKVEEEF